MELTFRGGSSLYASTRFGIKNNEEWRTIITRETRFSSLLTHILQRKKGNTIFISLLMVNEYYGIRHVHNYVLIWC